MTRRLLPLVLLAALLLPVSPASGQQACGNNDCIVVTLDNDVDGDDSFTDSEEAAAEGLETTLRVRVQNDAPGDLSSIDLTWMRNSSIPPPDADLDACVTFFSGTTIPQGESRTCTANVAAPGGGEFHNWSALVSGNFNTEVSAGSDSDSTFIQGPPPAVTLVVTKEVDADGDGTFDDTAETTSGEGDDATFRVTVASDATSQVDVVIDRATDTFGATVLELMGPDGPCAADFGEGFGSATNIELSPGDSATCVFTLADYGPAPGAATTNTVDVTVERSNESGPASGSDTARVDGLPLEFFVEVALDNDADGDGTASDDETADDPDQDVDFTATITNPATSDVEISLTAVVWQTPGGDDRDLLAEGACGDTPIDVPVGSSITCLFTEAAHSPAPGGSRTSTVVVDAVAAVRSPATRATVGETATASDDTTVRTAAAEPTPDPTTPTPEPMPTDNVTVPATPEPTPPTPTPTPEVAAADDDSLPATGGPDTLTLWALLLLAAGPIVLWARRYAIVHPRRR